MKTYVPSRSEWIERTKAKLDELDESLTELESRAAAAKRGVAEGLGDQVTAARQRIEEARARWNSAKNTADDVWENVSEEVGTAWEVNRLAVQNSIDEIRSALETS